jgi:hypothetical protein
MKRAGRVRRLPFVKYYAAKWKLLAKHSLRSATQYSTVLKTLPCLQRSTGEGGGKRALGIRSLGLDHLGGKDVLVLIEFLRREKDERRVISTPFSITAADQ